MNQDLLLPNEEVRFCRDIENLSLSGESFKELIVTDNRLIFYKKAGHVFKKDVIETVGRSTITGLKFEEKGVMRKKGCLLIYADEKRVLQGELTKVRLLYQFLVAKLD